MAADTTSSLVVPGDLLGSAAHFTAGAGTYARNGSVYAATCGHRRTRTAPPIPPPADVEQQPGIAAAEGGVAEAGGGASTSGKPELVVVAQDALPVVPTPGSQVTCKITRVALTSASCRVLCVGSQALTQEFKGVIRQQDVRATEIDKVVIYDCFRPGDVVRAEVLSLGDARSYYLTTAKNELGVVWAKSLAGCPMVAASWTSMQCPDTLSVEKRKVAQPLGTAAAAAAVASEKRKAQGEGGAAGGGVEGVGAGRAGTGPRKAARV